MSVRIPLAEITRQVRMATRMVENNVDDAAKMIRTASQQFDNAANRWNAQARQSEEKLRTMRATGRLNDAKARHNMIRTRIVPVQGLFRRAAQSIAEVQKASRSGPGR